jgi:hypothetical protein
MPATRLVGDARHKMRIAGEAFGRLVERYTEYRGCLMFAQTLDNENKITSEKYLLFIACEKFRCRIFKTFVLYCSNEPIKTTEWKSEWVGSAIS